MLVDLSHRFRRADVSNHHDGHQIWPVPFAVKTTNGIGLEILDDAVLADRQPFCILRPLEKLGIYLVEHALLAALAQPAFFQDDGPFTVDILIQIGHLMCPIFQNLEALFHIRGFFRRNGKDVYRFIETRVCVQVVSETDADILQE